MEKDPNKFAETASKFTNYTKEELNDKTHFRAWLHILLSGNSDKFPGIERLRVALGRDHKKYVWFATQMQAIFDVLCDDVHGKSPLEIRHMKRENFRQYVNFFTRDIRDALITFLENVY